MRKRVRLIAKDIINDSFPVLKEKRIFYLIMWFRFFGLCVWIPPFVRIIVISTRIKKLNDSAMRGIIAHELCHQEKYLKMSPWQYIRFAAKYLFFKKARMLEEKDIDRLTIEKGYGRELYELSLISRADLRHKNIIDNYMTPEDIKDYAIKTGKW
ncbi:MAG: hypothetical protein KA114_00550 [Bacteroidales bacterium]|nr:hypothetical protein [Bacteroidales bacterium]